jgi:hypothetical protein
MLPVGFGAAKSHQLGGDKIHQLNPDARSRTLRAIEFPRRFFRRRPRRKQRKPCRAWIVVSDRVRGGMAELIWKRQSVKHLACGVVSPARTDEWAYLPGSSAVASPPAGLWNSHWRAAVHVDGIFLPRSVSCVPPFQPSIRFMHSPSTLSSSSCRRRLAFIIMMSIRSGGYWYGVAWRAAAETQRYRDAETEDERESTREGSRRRAGTGRREQPREGGEPGKMAGAKLGALF